MNTGEYQRRLIYNKIINQDYSIESSNETMFPPEFIVEVADSQESLSFQKQNITVDDVVAYQYMLTSSTLNTFFSNENVSIDRDRIVVILRIGSNDFIITYSEEAQVERIMETFIIN